MSSKAHERRIKKKKIKKEKKPLYDFDHALNKVLSDDLLQIDANAVDGYYALLMGRERVRLLRQEGYCYKGWRMNKGWDLYCKLENHPRPEVDYIDCLPTAPDLVHHFKYLIKGLVPWDDYYAIMMDTRRQGVNQGPSVTYVPQKFCPHCQVVSDEEASNDPTLFSYAAIKMHNTVLSRLHLQKVKDTCKYGSVLARKIYNERWKMAKALWLKCCNDRRQAVTKNREFDQLFGDVIYAPDYSLFKRPDVMDESIYFIRIQTGKKKGYRNLLDDEPAKMNSLYGMFGTVSPIFRHGGSCQCCSSSG